MTMEDLMDDDRAWSMVAVASAALAAVATRNILEAVWEKVNRREPPKNPAARSTDWSEAILWTVASGVAVGVMRLLAQRGAAAGWKKVRGRYPSGLE